MGERRIGVLGLGHLGRAVATAAERAGSQVLAWSRSPSSRQHAARGDGDVEIPAAVQLLKDPAEVVVQTRLVFFALPCSAMQEVVTQVGERARGDHFWVHGSKSMAADGRLAHEVMRDRTCVKQIGCIGGPVLASELRRRVPAGLVAASPFDCVVDAMSQTLVSNGSRLHRSRDLVGLEIAGALRNVISVASGMADGMGEAARSALLARGLVETARLGAAMGAAPSTFVGIAGVGDLLARRESATSRNFQLGERCARGEPPAAILADLVDDVEGAITARAASKRAEALGIAMPLTLGVVQVLDEQLTAREMVEQILDSDTGLGAGDSLV